MIETNLFFPKLFPSGLETWLGFKSKISIDDFLKLLSLIKDDPKKATSTIFKKILKQIKDIGFSHTKVKDQSKLVLLAENNTLQPASGLNYFEEENSDFPKKSPLYLKNCRDVSRRNA
jgi:hypothetical protein